jgi:hypothetical protein
MNSPAELSSPLCYFQWTEHHVRMFEGFYFWRLGILRKLICVAAPYVWPDACSRTEFTMLWTLSWYVSMFFCSDPPLHYESHPTSRWFKYAQQPERWTVNSLLGVSNDIEICLGTAKFQTIWIRFQRMVSRRKGNRIPSCWCLSPRTSEYNTSRLMSNINRGMFMGTPSYLLTLSPV